MGERLGPEVCSPSRPLAWKGSQTDRERQRETETEGERYTKKETDWGGGRERRGRREERGLEWSWAADQTLDLRGDFRSWVFRPQLHCLAAPSRAVPCHPWPQFPHLGSMNKNLCSPCRPQSHPLLGCSQHQEMSAHSRAALRSVRAVILFSAPRGRLV